MKRTLLFTPILLLGALLQPAFAAHNTWDGDTNGNWDLLTNWVIQTTIPGATETATFNNNVNTSISLNGEDRAVRTFSFTGSTGSFTFGSGNSFLLGEAGNITLSSAAIGTNLIQTFNSGITFSGTSYAFNNSRADTGSALIFNGNITNSGTSTLTLSGAGTGTGNKIAGVISDGTGVQSVTATFSAGTWELSGSNTFSGNLTSSGAGGTLLVSGTNTNVGGTIVAGGTMNITGRISSSGTTSVSTGSLVLGNAGAGFNGGISSGLLTLAPAGTTTFIRSSDATSRTISNLLSLAATSGANNMKYGDATNNGSLIFTGATTLAGNHEVDPKSAVAFEGNIGDGGGGFAITRAGTGTGALFLMGNNTFSGTVTNGLGNGSSLIAINTLTNSGSSSSVGTSGTISMTAGSAGQTANGATLRYIGGTTTSNRTIDIAGNATGLNPTLDASGSGALSLTSNLTISGTSYTSSGNVSLVLTGVNTAENTMAGIIPVAPNSAANASTRSVLVTKNGMGTWLLSGSNTFAGKLAVNSGKLILDYGTSSTVLTATNAVDLGGATLELRGKTGAFSTTQTIGALGILQPTGASPRGSLNTILMNSNGGSGVTLTTGAVNPAGQNSLLVDLGGNASNVVNLGSAYTTSNNRVLIKDATGRIDWLKNTGASTASTALTSTTDIAASPASGFARLTGNQTITGNANTVTGLRIDPSANNQTLTLNQSVAGANTRISSLMLTGTNDFTIDSGTTTGGLGDNTTAATKLIVYQFGTGKLTLNAKLAGDSSGTGTGVLEFMGTGLVDWTKAANSSGQVWVSGVTLRQSGTTGQKLDSTASGLGSGLITLSNSAVIEVSDGTTITRNLGSAAGAVQWGGDGGFSAHGSNAAVQLNGNTNSIAWGATNFVPTNNSLVLSSASANATINFQNGLDFGNQQRVVTVNNGSASVDGVLSGVLSGGYGGGLIKRGAGTLEITGNSNTFEGETWVSAGTLLINNTSGSGAGTGNLTVQAGATLGGSGRVAGKVTVQTGGVLAPGNSSAILSTGSLSLSGTLAMELNSSTAGSGYDQVNVTGGVSLESGNAFSLTLGFTPLNGTNFFLINNDGNDAISGLLAGYAQGATFSASGQNFKISYIGDFGTNSFTGGNDLLLQAVPEPTTLVLLAFGLTAVMVRRRRRLSW